MAIRKVRCKGCSKLYHSKVEDDYSGYCADCENECKDSIYCNMEVSN